MLDYALLVLLLSYYGIYFVWLHARRSCSFCTEKNKAKFVWNAHCLETFYRIFMCALVVVICVRPCEIMCAFICQVATFGTRLYTYVLLSVGYYVRLRLHIL